MDPVTSGLDDTPRNRIAVAARDHGWTWRGWHVVSITRGEAEIRIIFQPNGNLTRAFNSGERYVPEKVGRRTVKVPEQIIRDLSAPPTIGSLSLLRR